MYSVNRPKDAVDEAKKRCRELRKRETPAETMLWELVRDRKLHGMKFYRQLPIFFELDGTTRFFIADFFCHESCLAIELDGPIHNHQKDQDIYRECVSRQLGISVVRFTNEEILRDGEFVCSELVRQIENARAITPPSLQKRRGLGDEFAKGCS
jgi:very-short-patch-repair endonuclease